MAFIDCGNSGVQNSDLVVFSRRNDYQLYCNIIYDVTNISEVIIKNGSRSSNPDDRLINVYLDDTLAYSIARNTSQTIDVSSVNEMKIVTQRATYVEDIFIIFKDFRGIYFEDAFLTSEDTTREKHYGNYYDISRFTSLELNNKSVSSNEYYRKICVYLDGAYEYNYLVARGETLTLDITNNYLMYISLQNSHYDVLYDLTLS